MSRQSTDPDWAQMPTLLLSPQATMFMPAVDWCSAISNHHYGPTPYPGAHCSTSPLKLSSCFRKDKPQEHKTTSNSFPVVAGAIPAAASTLLSSQRPRAPLSATSAAAVPAGTWQNVGTWKLKRGFERSRQCSQGSWSEVGSEQTKDQSMGSC